jgi:predicted nucleic acid-binding protein
MARYLIDSDILIDHLRGKIEAINFLKNILAHSDLVFYSVIAQAEIYAGMKHGEEVKISRLFESFQGIEINGKIAVSAGLYKRHYKLELADVLIAATASEINAILVTKNRKHYPMKEIQVHTPY